MTDPSFRVIVASLLAMLSNKPGRAQLVWFFAGSVLGPVLAALVLMAPKGLHHLAWLAADVSSVDR